MQSKGRLKKVARPEGERVCCSLLKKVRLDVESYLQELIQARDDFAKMKWAWGIIAAVKQMTEIRGPGKEKSFPCEKCKLYLEPRKRLAELVIQGGRSV